jgi:hypothetical protein
VPYSADVRNYVITPNFFGTYAVVLENGDAWFTRSHSNSGQQYQPGTNMLLAWTSNNITKYNVTKCNLKVLMRAATTPAPTPATHVPTPWPTGTPTAMPTADPTQDPTPYPTWWPTISPTPYPTLIPSSAPTIDFEENTEANAAAVCAPSHLLQTMSAIAFVALLRHQQPSC